MNNFDVLRGDGSFGRIIARMLSSIIGTMNIFAVHREIKV